MNQWMSFSFNFNDSIFHITFLLWMPLVNRGNGGHGGDKIFLRRGWFSRITVDVFSENSSIIYSKLVIVYCNPCLFPCSRVDISLTGGTLEREWTWLCNGGCSERSCVTTLSPVFTRSVQGNQQYFTFSDHFAIIGVLLPIPSSVRGGTSKHRQKLLSIYPPPPPPPPHTHTHTHTHTHACSVTTLSNKHIIFSNFLSGAILAYFWYHQSSLEKLF